MYVCKWVHDFKFNQSEWSNSYAQNKAYVCLLCELMLHLFSVQWERAALL